MMRSARNRLFEEKSELIDQAMKRHGRVIQIYRLCREDVRQELALRMLECLDRYDFRRCPNLDAYLVEQLTKELAQQNGVTEELKATNQMAWVQAMNNFKASAEEVVLRQLIYS